MDMTTGKMLNDFTGHTNDSYRCRACFGHGEASVVCGDEDGKVWAWDLLDVRLLIFLEEELIPLFVRPKSSSRILLPKFIRRSSPGRNTIRLVQVKCSRQVLMGP